MARLLPQEIGSKPKSKPMHQVITAVNLARPIHESVLPEDLQEEFAKQSLYFGPTPSVTLFGKLICAVIVFACLRSSRLCYYFSNREKSAGNSIN